MKSDAEADVIDAAVAWARKRIEWRAGATTRTQLLVAEEALLDAVGRLEPRWALLREYGQ